MMKVKRFFESVHWDNRMRPSSAKRKLGRDLLLYFRGRFLSPVEWALRSRYGATELPVVFIVGVPRSGTTLLYQLVSEYLDVGFINNRMAPYWITPILGAVLHGKTGGRHGLELVSQSGRAAGDYAPHEFGWFWHFYGEFGEHDHLTEEELDAIDWRPIKRSLEGVAAYLARPLVMKSLNYVNYHIAYLKRVLPSAKFIWIRREPSFTVQSILRVREAEYGDAKQWWSVRTRDVDDWRAKPALEQVVHQVRDLTCAIRAGIARVPPEDVLHLTYESLGAEPFDRLGEVAEFIGTRYGDPTRLKSLRLEARNTQTVDDTLWASIQETLAAGAS